MKAPDQLLPLLDEQTQLLQQKLALLQRMRRCVTEGQIPALADLLRQEADLTAGGAALQQRLEGLCREIARASGWPLSQVTLGRLVESLSGPEAIALNDRRERLAAAVQRLQEESAATARLVRHALEFNNRLLAALLGTEEAGTYSAEGAVETGCGQGTFRHSV
ncbi:MAG: flagellar export chaperone FlgN [Planctomycetota bacterium]|jgi:flagellar biosynthesis/type III secretory pathway chaperone